jgi:hypothetical protein
VIPVSYYVPGEFTSPKVAYAFAKGCGGTITDEEDFFPGPVATFGTPPRVAAAPSKAQAEGRDIYYADHAYFQPRQVLPHHQERVSARRPRDVDRRSVSSGSTRPIKPWRTSGSHILLCPNSAVYFGFHGIDVEQWLADVTATLRQHTGSRDSHVRWKTQRRESADRARLGECVGGRGVLERAALDGLIAGVPNFTLAPFASIGPDGTVGSEPDRGSPFYPDDRESFLSVLADNQWTIQEILKGVAWRALQEQEARAA